VPINLSGQLCLPPFVVPLQEDITPSTLISDRSYYSPDWNNLAWATNALLYKVENITFELTTGS
jgi:hypothetical protein